MTQRKSHQHLRGVSTVELAVCLPVIMLIVVASIEACSLIFLQQSLQTVAYETARFATAPHSTSAAAVSRGEQVLADREVNGAVIDLTPDDMSTAVRGTHVLVTVTAPLGGNRVIPEFFYGDQQLEANATMVKE
jgi:Flp pilus assembly protein TadG